MARSNELGSPGRGTGVTSQCLDNWGAEEGSWICHHPLAGCRGRGVSGFGACWDAQDGVRAWALGDFPAVLSLPALVTGAVGAVPYWLLLGSHAALPGLVMSMQWN